MVDIWVQSIHETWFAIAACRDELVATAVGSSRETAIENLMHSIPSSAPHRIAGEPSEFADATISMLAELERGDERNKHCILCEEYIPETLRLTLQVAAMVPLGYVTTYGNIASLVHTQARMVGRIMATNPLYPIVACHRIVGADLALVGYAGRQDDSALRDKLNRLSKETKGLAEKHIPVGKGTLFLYPVEWAVKKAEYDLFGSDHQLTLFE